MTRMGDQSTTTRLALTAALLITAGYMSDGQPVPTRRQLVEELRLDANTEDFPGILRFAVGPRGQIAIPIRADLHVRFYDAQGRKLGTFGRPGSGPGEFRDMGRFGWLSDTLWVYDGSQHRITYVSPELKHIRTEILAPQLNEGATARGSSDSGSVYLFVPAALPGNGRLVGPAMIAVRQSASSGATRSVMISTTADGSGRKELATIPTPEKATLVYRPGDGSAVTRGVPFGFYAQPEYAVDGSRVAWLTTEPGDRGGQYTVTVIASGGDTVLSRAYPYVGTPIPKSVMDSAIGSIAMPSGGRAMPPKAAATLQHMARAAAPRFYPPVSGIVVGLDNTTWIQLRPTKDGTESLVLDVKGNVVARVLVPPRSNLVQARLDRVWLREIDDDGLASIVRYRLK